MAKFNRKALSPTLTTNLAGGEAYQVSPQLQFVTTLLTSFAEDQYYRKASGAVRTVRSLIDQFPDKLFAAKAAIFARNEFGVRSITHVVAGEIANRVKGVGWTKRFFNAVVRRPDDILEILAYYLATYGKPLPNSLKKGLAASFDKFDKYQLAKYRGESHDVSLVDAVNLVHPKPVAKNAEALRQLIKDALKSTETWEAKLTTAGQAAQTEAEKEELKSQAWTELIREKKLGYFALLRNLRNVVQQAPEILEDALSMLVDPQLIEKSLVLPFRFGTAYKEMALARKSASTKAEVSLYDKVAGALATAASISLNNVPKLPGKTLVALDVSGSMEGKPFDIGSMFAVALVGAMKADLIIFSNSAKYLKLTKTEDIFENIDYIYKHSDFGGTDFHSVFRTAKHAYDRIIILSDMQAWVGYYTPKESVKAYKKATGADPLIYSFDLQGYGTLQFPESKVFALAGWSDKVFDIMKILETDRQALINTINAVTF
jgi:60 kDa SS-A/Ro ribonucleoprotein